MFYFSDIYILHLHIFRYFYENILIKNIAIYIVYFLYLFTVQCASSGVKMLTAGSNLEIFCAMQYSDLGLQ